MLLFLISLSGFSQENPILKKPKVDHRVELTSIVFRLAECREYNSQRFKKYVADIEAHFAPYKDHPLISFIKADLRNAGIGYDAVASMAISITNPPNMKPIVPFTERTPESRWSLEHATKFLKLLNEFYIDANCAAFFSKQKDLYELASERFGEVYEQLDLEWYKKFYGEDPKGVFTIINGLGNGGSNYGPDFLLPNGKREIYAIMGTWSFDDKGEPIYPVKRYFPTLLHEFNHSFVNHVVEKFHSEFKESGETIYAVLGEQMNDQAYGDWEVMYAEAVVRAAVVKYMIDHEYEEKEIKKEVNRQLERGFVWTDELVYALNRYDKNRDQFPSLESFMPGLVIFFDEVASNIGKIKADVEAKRPRVSKIKPLKNGSKKVDPSIEEIIVAFDRPLRGSGYSIHLGEGGEETFPDIQDIKYAEDNKSVILTVKLEPNKDYEFILTGNAFKSEDGFGIANYEVNFHTKKK